MSGAGRSPSKGFPSGPTPSSGPVRFTVAVVDLVLAATKPWTYWLAPVITLVAVLGLLGVFVAYLLKVTASRYPKQ